MKKISIVVAMYNLQDKILGCLDSLHKQTNSNVEFILVNDGSTDDTLKRVQKYIKTKGDDRFKLFTKENGGLSDTRNYGLKKANGKYIWFMDGDDRIVDNAVDDLESQIENGYDILQFNFSIESESGLSRGIESGLLENHGYNGIEFLKLQQRNGNNFSNTVWHYLFNKNFLIENEMKFPLEYSIQEDTFFTTMCLLKAKKVGYFDKQLYLYMLNQDSVTRKADRKANNIVQSWKIYNDIEQRMLNLDVNTDFLKDDYNKRYIAMLTENFYLGNPLNFKRKDITNFFKNRNLDFKDKIKKSIYLLPASLRKSICTRIYQKYM